MSKVKKVFRVIALIIGIPLALLFIFELGHHFIDYLLHGIPQGEQWRGTGPNLTETLEILSVLAFIVGFVLFFWFARLGAWLVIGGAVAFALIESISNRMLDIPWFVVPVFCSGVLLLLTSVKKPESEPPDA